MKADTILWYCVSKPVTKEALQRVHKYGIRLISVEVGVFLITTLENTPTFFQEPLKFIGHEFIDYISSHN